MNRVVTSDFFDQTISASCVILTRLPWNLFSVFLRFFLFSFSPFFCENKWNFFSENKPPSIFSFQWNNFFLLNNPTTESGLLISETNRISLELEILWRSSNVCNTSLFWIEKRIMRMGFIRIFRRNGPNEEASIGDQPMKSIGMVGTLMVLLFRMGWLGQLFMFGLLEPMVGSRKLFLLKLWKMGWVFLYLLGVDWRFGIT